jgi:hypothetical protein
MSVESGVFTLLSTNADLAALMGVALPELGGYVYRTGRAIDPPDVFVAIRWEENPAPVAFLTTQGLTIRAHSREGSYELIDGMLDRCKTILTSTVHFQGITQVDWRGRSPDLFDDGYRTATRYDTYVVAGGITAGRK